MRTDLALLAHAAAAVSFDADRDSPDRAAYAATARALWRRGAHAPCVTRPRASTREEASLVRAEAFAHDTELDAVTRDRHVMAESKRLAKLEAAHQRTRGLGWGRAAAFPPSTRLNLSVCQGMLADRSQVLHAMWGMAWYKMGPICMPASTADGESWIDAMESGDMCTRNWFHNTFNCTSSNKQVPNFLAELGGAAGAPALLGTDPSIEERCMWWVEPPENDRAAADGGGDGRRLNSRGGGRQLWPNGRPRRKPRKKVISGKAKQRCILAGYNVLSLYGKGPRYNLCRNLEWVVCAARGRLHRQPSSILVFDPPPSQLSLELTLPVEGMSPDKYAPRYVYIVEVCALTMLCENAEHLFVLTTLQPFICHWRPGGLRALVRLLEGGRRWLPSRVAASKRR